VESTGSAEGTNEAADTPLTADLASEGLDLLERMLLIRAFEEKVSELYARGRIAGLIHLGIGQEAVAVGVCSLLREEDTVFGGHRSHGHALAKGADPARTLAEIAGRAAGYGKGKGGSMHLVAADAGFVTATGVVAGNIPLALGGALAAQQAGAGGVAVAFFGDGAGQSGQFHESLNLAALWSLPVLFVCENNGYAEFSPLSAHTRVERLAAYASTYGMPAETVDGNDLFAVRAAARVAIERGRRGEGPTFLECLTYRLRGHYEGDPGTYRDRAELADWRARDPIDRLVARLIAAGVLDAGMATDARQRAQATIAEAAEAALGGPPPAAEELTMDVYAR
jgi:TPP-dependent pyruvate/acetoin dehydrogenase alpha subunit